MMGATRIEDLQLQENGSNTRILSGLNKAFGALLLLTIAFGILYLSLHLANPNTLPIRKVHVVGNFRHLSPTSMQAIVTKEVRGGFFNVNVAEIRRALLNAPWVEQVAVNRIWPDTLRVNVKEQVAVVRWGERGLLNADADYFEPLLATIPNDLPKLDGPANSHDLLLTRFNELKEILSNVDLQLAELSLNERRAWSFRLSSGINVVLGREQYERRVLRFVQVVVKALAAKLDQIETIDMRYTNGFTVEWRQPSVNNPGAAENG